jgi:hypothetical protein|tara:strand:- start:1127 stop:2866 length:1740 start_codon:yes stop_codon:yes gene_type:complete
MPDSSEVRIEAFNCEGGLVLNRSTFLMKPGEALKLENFEPDIEGGYRRLSGHRKFVNQIVPQTSSSGEKVLMVSKFADKVLAARGEKIFSSASTESAAEIASTTGMTGSGSITVDSTTGFSTSGSIQIDNELFTYTGVTNSSFTGVTRATASTTAAAHLINSVVSENWTERDTGRSSADKYRFERFNFDGNDKIIFVDGANAPVVFNTSIAATDVGASSVAGSKFVAAYREHMFYAGKSSTPQELIFSVPFDEDDFTASDGAGSIKVDDNIVGLKVFRESLFIFCENRIFKLTGSALSDFAVQPVTRNIGCINGDTIQEFAGDLVFLGPDGLRTVAATAKIGDVELGTISRNIQSIFDTNIRDAALFESVTIPDKTQYRIFFTKDGQTDSLTRGAICVMKGEGFEFSEIRGIRPSCADTFISTGDVFVLHGDFRGFVHRQESGNTFDGTVILGNYRSPDMSFGDTGIRKHMNRVIINYKPESAIDADLFLRYDNEDSNSARPDPYPLDSSRVAAQYGVATYSTSSGATQFVYGGASQPLVRQAVEGSGFSVALKVDDGGETAPYSLKGFQLEYQLGARR